MIEAKDDLFTFNCDAVCITTNGVIGSSGDAVMGAGVALLAKQRWPWLPRELGYRLRNGNHVYRLQPPPDLFSYRHIYSFPTKNNWRDKSDLGLIRRSAAEMATLASNNNYTVVALPRPGCGNGGLVWEEVRTALSPILDDRFVVLTP